MPRKDFSREVVFDEEHSFGRVFKIIPSKQIKTLSMRWTMPVSKMTCRKKSAHYLSHVLGHEGPNSLLSELIRASLATGLSAGSSARLNQSFDIFAITISLTDKGEKDYKRVMELVYMYINQIRDLGPQEYIYTEMQQKHLIDFQMLSKTKAVQYANAIGRRMAYVPDDPDMDNVVRFQYAYEDFEAKDI